MIDEEKALALLKQASSRKSPISDEELIRDLMDKMRLENDFVLEKKNNCILEVTVLGDDQQSLEESIRNLLGE